MSRLDQLMVERGLCESRERAKRAIMAGMVMVNDHPARKPGDSIAPEDKVILLAPEKYVSRGGYKLEHALQHFKVDVAGKIAIDLGASTGGFTDCLLQNGAAKVYAVDVGRGQLAWKLRRNKRVVVMEKTNARELTPEKIVAAHCERRTPRQSGDGHRPPLHFNAADLITIDCSFISLRKILPAAIALLKASGKVVALIKPQFEAGKTEADKGRGVISDPAIHQRVLHELEEFVRNFRSEFGVQSSDSSNSRLEPRNSKLVWRGVTESPLLGPAGNKEFLVLIEKAG